MGNEFSSTNFKPGRKADCLTDDGDIDLQSYYSYGKGKRQKRRKHDFQRMFEECLRLAEEELKDIEKEVVETPSKKRTKQGFYHRNKDGEIVPMTWRDSSWYIQYVCPLNVERNSQSRSFKNKFRRRFRLPYSEFDDFVAEAKASPLFERWDGQDATGKHSSPIELLILGSLRYLGRGWTFDDIEEATCISREVHRTFFHLFISWGSTSLFETYVITPRTNDEAKHHEKEMAMAGFNGAVGSSDATHVGMEKCSAWLSQAHSGPKLKLPSRTYNMTVNHRRRILSSTSGHPARWNDKTLQLYDEFMKGLYNGDILDEFEFCLFEKDRRGRKCKATYKGPWVLVDNGYIHWPTAIPPFKFLECHKEIRWSKWLESMRKDVECAFGILKGRFRILKTGVRTHGVEACDKIWRTCCALHNMLLEIDGLEEGWENGVSSSWEGELGQHDASVSALARLLTPEQFATHDHSGMGVGTDAPDQDEENVNASHKGLSYSAGDTQQVRVVRDLDFNFFRGRLVEHFDIMFQEGTVQWPARNCKKI
jgi:hypothetical protein